MADRYIQQATSTLNPVYATQEKAINSQVPAIQKLYDTLSQGLQTTYDTQLQTGTQNIVEDASARGVLRSTLPVDARQGLVTQLGQALVSGKAQLGAQQAGDIANINEKLGSLRIQKASSIQDLANQLRSGALSEREFAFKVKEANRSYALEQQKIAISRAAAAAKTVGFDPSVASKISGYLSQLTGPDGKVSPTDYGQAKSLWVAQGGKAPDFDKTFAPMFANYSHLQDYTGEANRLPSY